MKIIFKNGRDVIINQVIADILNENLIKGCSNFQSFSDENRGTYLIVNMQEVSCIIDEKINLSK